VTVDEGQFSLEKAGKNAEDESTKLRLIEAGLAAFATKGLQGASLRSVNQAADARNSGATHYHFGNRLGLVRAIVDYITVMHPGEYDNFAAAFAPSADPLLYEIARFLSPFFLIRSRDPWGHDALLLFSQIVSSADPEISPLGQVALGLEAEQDLERISVYLPWLDSVTVKRRLIYAALQVIHALASPVGLEQTVFGNISHTNNGDAIVDLLHFIRGGIAAPLPPPRG
jgi:AcrR family transcriptional regulator